MPRCGWKPQGYEPCTKEIGHEGKCRCKLVDFEVEKESLESVAIDFERTPEELEALWWESVEGMFGKRGSA